MPGLLAAAVPVIKRELIALAMRCLRVLLMFCGGVLVIVLGGVAWNGAGLVLLLGGAASPGSTVSTGPDGSIVISAPAAGGGGVAGASPLATAFAAAAAAPCAVTGGVVYAVASIEDSSYGQRHAVGAPIFLAPSGQTIHAYGPAQFLIGTWNTYGDQPLQSVFVGSQEQPPPPAAFIWLPEHAYPALARYLCALHVDRDPATALWSYSGCVPGPGCGRTDDYAIRALKIAAQVEAAGPPAPATTDARVVTLISNARSWLGVKYVFGGCSSSGVDCSCFTQIMFRSVGVGLDRTAQRQWDEVLHVSRPQVGDEAFFRQTYYDPNDIVTHVGIVTDVSPSGVVTMIDAPGARAASDPPDFPDGHVREEPIAGFWAAHLIGFGRPLPPLPQSNLG